jgi:hypothetical protein
MGCVDDLDRTPLSVDRAEGSLALGTGKLGRLVSSDEERLDPWMEHVDGRPAWLETLDEGLGRWVSSDEKHLDPWMERVDGHLAWLETLDEEHLGPWMERVGGRPAWLETLGGDLDSWETLGDLVGEHAYRVVEDPADQDRLDLGVDEA